VLFFLFLFCFLTCSLCAEEFLNCRVCNWLIAAYVIAARACNIPFSFFWPVDLFHVRNAGSRFLLAFHLLTISLLSFLDERIAMD